MATSYILLFYAFFLLVINELNWVCTPQLVHTWIWVCENEEPLPCVENLMHKRRILSNSAKFRRVIVGQDSRHGRKINEITT